MRVMVGNVNPGLVTSDYMKALLDFMLYDLQNRQIFRGYLPWRASSLIDIYRNMIVDQFLTQTDDDYLWFIDSDIVIDNTTLYSLVDTCEEFGFPLISGIYPTVDQFGMVHPSLWRLGEENGRTTMVQLKDVPNEPLVEVDGVGAGCLLIHRSLLEKMRAEYGPAKPWFDMGVFFGIPFGEDYTFCMRVKEMGFPIMANTKVRVDHFKELKLTLKEPECQS